MRMALPPSAVEMLPAPQPRWPSSPRRTTASAIKAALLVSPHSAARTRQCSKADSLPNGVGLTQADAPPGHGPPPAPGKSLQNTTGSLLR